MGLLPRDEFFAVRFLPREPVLSIITLDQLYSKSFAIVATALLRCGVRRPVRVYRTSEGSEMGGEKPPGARGDNRGERAPNAEDGQQRTLRAQGNRGGAAGCWGGRLEPGRRSPARGASEEAKGGGGGEGGGGGGGGG